MIHAYTAAEIRAAEEPLLVAGPPGALMAHAAFALATEVVRELRSAGRRVPGTRVLALVGGGNNGGDALHAAAFLARRGAVATAALLTSDSHAGGATAARAAGVRIVDVAGSIETAATQVAELAQGSDVWLDGLAGIGVRGGLREPLAGAVRVLDAVRQDRSAGPGDRGGAGAWRSASAPTPAPIVVAVDTPSGIGVDDGTMPGPVLPADVTVTMGAVKPGLLLPPAAALAGDVRLVDIGLRPGLEKVAPAAIALEVGDVAALWPFPGRTAHKYDRGVLGIVAGSPRYPGAGVLAVAGALGAGLGMVRYLGDDAVLRLVHATHPEVVGAAGRVQAWALGSGVEPGDGPTMGRLGELLLRAVDEGLPVVLDAGALALLEPGRADHVDLRLPASVVLTPHAGELAALLSARGVRVAGGAPVGRQDVEAAPLRWARQAAVETGASVLLKGAVTVVVGPTGPAYAQADATPWLATAGAGDVLAGVLGALLAGQAAQLAQDPSLAQGLAASAALVHGRAALAASAGGPIVAGDVARWLPAAVRDVLRHR